MSSVLSFDLGASSGRGVLIDKQFEMNEIIRFTDYTLESENGLQWDFDKIMNNIFNGIKKAESIEEFSSIGIDTWGVDFGLLDKAGNLIEFPYHYRDERTIDMAIKVLEIVDEVYLYEHTGLQLMEINTLFQLFYLKEYRPDIFNKIDKILMMPDLINYYLTGEIFAERTIASTTQLYNPRLKNWDFELIEKLGFDKEIFPEIINPGEVVGNVKPEILNKVDNKNVEVIAVGSHDTASAVLCTRSKENRIFLSSGTWSLIGAELNDPVINEKSRKMDLSNETGISKITLLKNITGMWLINESKKQFELEGREYNFSELVDAANSANEIDLYFDTDLPELTLPGDIPGKIRKYALETNQTVPQTDGELIKAIYTNLALKYKYSCDQLEELTNNEFNELFIVGGGSKADLLSQYTSNAINKIVITGYSEATALGNAAIQLISLGVFHDLSEALEKLNQTFKTKSFEPENTEAWQLKYEKYLDIV